MRLFIQNHTVLGGEDLYGHLLLSEKSSGQKFDTVGEAAFRGNAQITDLVLDEGIGRIQAYAFADCENLRTVSLPRSLYEIHPTAFSGCSQITVTAAGESYAYTYCREQGIECRQRYAFTLDENGVLTAYRGEGNVLFIPRRTRVIAPGVFRGGSFTSAAFDDTPLVIGEEAFADCKNLCEISIKHTVHTIGSRAFAGCGSLKTVYLPSNLRDLGEGVFENCQKLSRCDLPKGIRSIPARMFYGCERIAHVFIPDGVKKIGAQAFADCGKLLVMDIPASVEEIAEDAFSGCEKVLVFAREHCYAIEFAKAHGLDPVCLYDLD